MSPIDDELRTALQRRATAVAPSPDPLAGIERRAGRMHRNRVAASVAGSVLAVAAIATAVPLLGGAAGQGPDVPTRVATQAPSATPSAVVTTSPYALDPTSPWRYRGDPLASLGQGFVETATGEYAVKHGVDAEQVQLTPLFGRVYEPSGQSELFFVATVAGEHRWGFVQSGEAGAEFPVDEALSPGTLALPAALPGDEVARLTVVASPEVGEIQYGPDDASEWATMTTLADGVAITALEGDPQTASYRVLDPTGSELLRAPVPPVAAPAVLEPEPPVPGDEVPVPTNVVDWPVRGSVPDEVAEQAVVAFAEAAGVPRDEVSTKLLFGAERDGKHYVLLQGWYGSDARAFAWASGPGGSQSALMQFTAPGPAAFGAVLDGVLMVVPEPAAGQVLYAPDATSELQPVPDQGTEAAVLIDRAPDASGDRVLILDGNGDPERPILRGSVDDLLLATSN